MTDKVEVIYFPKPCPHCKEQLFRVEKTSVAWSECRNEKCSFIVNQVPETREVRGEAFTLDPVSYTECYNRR